MEKDNAELSQDIEYQLLMTSLNASVSKHLLDEHFTLVTANSRYYEMFGYKKEEYEKLYHNRPDLFYKNDPDDWHELSQIVMDTIQQGKNRYDAIVRMRHKNGQRLWIKVVGNFTDEYVNGYRISYSVMMDVSELMQNKIEKETTENNFPGLIAKYKITQDGLESLDGNYRFRDFFRQHLSIHLNDMSKENGLEEVADNYSKLRQGESFIFNISPYDAYNEQKYLTVSAQCIDKDKDDPIYLLLFSDITELTLQKQQLQQYNQSLHKLAFSDEVTKGYNRRKFDLVAGDAVRSHKPGTYAMVWLNLQKFKIVNEIAGIEAGDIALKYIYRQLREHLDEDEYVARLFSDNFVILIKTDGEKSIEERLNQCIQDINSYNDKEEYKYYLTFMAGIYLINEPDISVTYMQDRAHAAIKSSNDQNSDLCIMSYYNEAIRIKMLDEKDIENRMREALKNDEFEVYLQPKYSLKKKTILGAEALVRWNHPQRGFLPPSEFIPIFETNGFIIQLDLYVFEKVCECLKRWQDEGKEMLTISINMSRSHFSKNGFLDEYVRIKNKYGISAKYLEIELTETLVFENPEIFINIIQKIHKEGFSCSMDDFGSGYSTLNTLKDLDVDTIKLDKAFFSSEKMENNRENIIIGSVLDMAKSLDMETVAEGIETMEQVDFLSQTSCDLVQGYVFSKPLPILSFEKLWFEQNKKITIDS